jgi:hypothetical protein
LCRSHTEQRSRRETADDARGNFSVTGLRCVRPQNGRRRRQKEHRKSLHVLSSVIFVEAYLTKSKRILTLAN